MPTLPTAPPSVSLLTSPPNRFSDGGDVFASKADLTMTELNPMGTSQNALAAWQESTAEQVYDNAVEAANSATSSELSAAMSANSASLSASNANIKGQWSAQSGSATKPYSVYHNGSLWALLNNLANVALSEPSLTNPDWQFISGTRWQQTVSSSGSAGKNAMHSVYATVGAVDITLPAMVDGDFIVIHNDPSSTQTVRVINAGYNIRSATRAITSSDNIVLAAGETVYLQCRSSTELKVIS